MNAEKLNLSLESTATIPTIMTHRSIRVYQDRPLSQEIVDTILEAGLRASTYAHVMPTKVIRITDLNLRDQLREICHQPYVSCASEFFVFCVDYQRIKAVVPEAEVDTLDVLVTGAIDAGVFAQNVLLAAESLGLGGIFIGAIRDNLARVDELLQLPKYVVPLFGLCIGYPEAEPNPTPRLRLPLSSVVSENTFHGNSEAENQEFNQQSLQYAQQHGGLATGWNERIAKVFAEPNRPALLAYLQSKGLCLK